MESLKERIQRGGTILEILRCLEDFKESIEIIDDIEEIRLGWELFCYLHNHHPELKAEVIKTFNDLLQIERWLNEFKNSTIQDQIEFVPNDLTSGKIIITLLNAGANPEKLFRRNSALKPFIATQIDELEEGAKQQFLSIVDNFEILKQNIKVPLASSEEDDDMIMPIVATISTDDFEVDSGGGRDNLSDTQKCSPSNITHVPENTDRKMSIENMTSNDTGPAGDIKKKLSIENMTLDNTGSAGNIKKKLSLENIALDNDVEGGSNIAEEKHAVLESQEEKIIDDVSNVNVGSMEKNALRAEQKIISVEEPMVKEKGNMIFDKIKDIKDGNSESSESTSPPRFCLSSRQRSGENEIQSEDHVSASSTASNVPSSSAGNNNSDVGTVDKVSPITDESSIIPSTTVVPLGAIVEEELVKRFSQTKERSHSENAITSAEEKNILPLPQEDTPVSTEIESQGAVLDCVNVSPLPQANISVSTEIESQGAECERVKVRDSCFRSSEIRNRLETSDVLSETSPTAAVAYDTMQRLLQTDTALSFGTIDLEASSPVSTCIAPSQNNETGDDTLMENQSISLTDLSRLSNGQTIESVINDLPVDQDVPVSSMEKGHSIETAINDSIADHEIVESVLDESSLISDTADCVQENKLENETFLGKQVDVTSVPQSLLREDPEVIEPPDQLEGNIFDETSKYVVTVDGPQEEVPLSEVCEHNNTNKVEEKVRSLLRADPLIWKSLDEEKTIMHIGSPENVSFRPSSPERFINEKESGTLSPTRIPSPQRAVCTGKDFFYHASPSGRYSMPGKESFESPSVRYSMPGKESFESPSVRYSIPGKESFASPSTRYSIPGKESFTSPSTRYSIPGKQSIQSSPPMWCSTPGKDFCHASPPTLNSIGSPYFHLNNVLYAIRVSEDDKNDNESIGQEGNRSTLEMPPEYKKFIGTSSPMAASERSMLSEDVDGQMLPNGRVFRLDHHTTSDVVYCRIDSPETEPTTLPPLPEMIEPEESEESSQDRNDNVTLPIVIPDPITESTERSVPPIASEEVEGGSSSSRSVPAPPPIYDLADNSGFRTSDFHPKLGPLEEVPEEDVNVTPKEFVGGSQGLRMSQAETNCESDFQLPIQRLSSLNALLPIETENDSMDEENSEFRTALSPSFAASMSSSEGEGQKACMHDLSDSEISPRENSRRDTDVGSDIGRCDSLEMMDIGGTPCTDELPQTPVPGPVHLKIATPGSPVFHSMATPKGENTDDEGSMRGLSLDLDPGVSEKNRPSETLRAVPSKLRLSMHRASSGYSIGNAATKKKSSIFHMRMDDSESEMLDNNSIDDGEDHEDRRYSIDGMYNFDSNNKENIQHVDPNLCSPPDSDRSQKQEEFGSVFALAEGFAFLLECGMLGYDDAVPNCDDMYADMVEQCELEGKTRQAMVDAFIECPELELSADALNFMSSRVPSLGMDTVAAIWSSIRSSALIASLFSHPLVESSTQIKVLNTIGPVRPCANSIQDEAKALAKMILRSGGNTNEVIQNILQESPPLPKANLHFQNQRLEDLVLPIICTFLSDRGFFLPLFATFFDTLIKLYSIFPPLLYLTFIMLIFCKNKIMGLPSLERTILQSEAILLYHSSLPVFITSDSVFLFLSGIYTMNFAYVLLSMLGPWTFWKALSNYGAEELIHIWKFSITQKQMFQGFQFGLVAALLCEVVSPRNFFVTVPVVIFKIIALWGERNIYFQLLRPEMALQAIGFKDAPLREIHLQLFRSNICSGEATIRTDTNDTLLSFYPRAIPQYLVFTLQELALPIGAMLGFVLWCPTGLLAKFCALLLGTIIATYVCCWHHQLDDARTVGDKLDRLLLLLPKVPEHPEYLDQIFHHTCNGIQQLYMCFEPFAEQLKTREFTFGFQLSDW